MTRIVSFILLCAALLSCSLSSDGLDDRAPSGKSGSLIVLIGNDGARTLVPDILGSAESYTLTYTHATNPESSGTATILTGTAFTVQDIMPGNLVLSVEAYSSETVRDASTRIAGGTQTVTIVAGVTVNTSIILMPSQNPAITTGNFSLGMRWPLGTVAGYVEAELRDSDGDPIETIVPAVLVGTSYSATIEPDEDTSLASGRYTLVVSFYASADKSVIKGVFTESVNVYDGLTSDRWIDQDGELSAIRLFTVGDFASSSTGVHVIATLGTFTSNADFASTGQTRLSLSLTTESVLNVMLTTNVEGQSFIVSLNGSPSVTMTGGEFRAFALASGINALNIMVTAPDGSTATAYQINATKVVGPITTVATENELADMANGNYVITGNITLSDLWTPIIFSGNLDGGGHSIEELEVEDNTQFTGLFSQNTGIVTNLIIREADEISNTTGESFSGIFAGENAGTLYHCAVSGTITNTATTSHSGDRVGGLAGHNMGTIKECYSVATVIAKNAYYVANLVGSNQGTIIDSYSRGPVEGDSCVGGIAGYHENSGSNVTRCYSTGEIVIHGGTAGGCVGGTYDSATVVLSYYDSETTVLTATALGAPHGIARTTAEMKLASTYIDWNFTSVWAIDPLINDGYPHLRYFGAGTMVP